jgi:hypothetical protein
LIYLHDLGDVCLLALLCRVVLLPVEVHFKTLLELFGVLQDVRDVDKSISPSLISIKADWMLCKMFVTLPLYMLPASCLFFFFRRSDLAVLHF